MALSPSHRLTKKKDFDFVFKRGAMIRGAFITIKTALVSDSLGRFGFVIPARIIKTAVGRNRTRRILSGTVQMFDPAKYAGRDTVILIIKAPPSELGSLRDDLKQALAKIKDLRR